MACCILPLVVVYFVFYFVFSEFRDLQARALLSVWLVVCEIYTPITFLYLFLETEECTPRFASLVSQFGTPPPSLLPSYPRVPCLEHAYRKGSSYSLGARPVQHPKQLAHADPEAQAQPSAGKVRRDFLGAVHGFRRGKTDVEAVIWRNVIGSAIAPHRAASFCIAKVMPLIIVPPRAYFVYP